MRKNRKKKGRKLKILGIVLAVILALLGAGAIGAHHYLNSTASGPSPVGKQYKGKPISKSETVYVDTNSYGKAEMVTVDALLRNNPGGDKMTDTTNLTNIVNINGNEGFEDNGDGTITWNAQGRNMFYEGNASAKDLPLDVKVKYYLDGKKISAKKLVGKSGDLEIHVKYKNKTAVMVKDQERKVPFVVVAAIIVNDKSMSKIKVSNGTVVESGKMKIAMGMAVPGLAKELDSKVLDSKFGNEVVFKCKATNFKQNEILSIVTCDSIDKVSNSVLKKMNMDKKISLLDKSTKKLIKGTGKLHKGTTTLKKNLPKYTDGVKKATVGSKKLTAETENALKTMRYSISQMNALTGGIMQVTTYAGRAIGEGVISIENQGEIMRCQDETLDTLDSQIEGLIEIADSIEDENVKMALLNQAAELEETAKTLRYNNDQLMASNAVLDKELRIFYALLITGQPDGMDVSEYEAKLKDFLEAQGYSGDSLDNFKREDGSYMSLVEVMGVLQEGESKLEKGIVSALEDKGSLMDGMRQLNQGMDKLDKNSDKLNKGAKKLDKGTKTLNKGMVKYYEKGIKKLVGMYSEYLKGVSSTLKELKAADKEYNNFSGLTKGQTGSVKFVYFTPLGEK